LSSQNTEETGDLELESGKKFSNFGRAEISGSTASLPSREKTMKNTTSNLHTEICVTLDRLQ
jgi:hypothetical protein